VRDEQQERDEPTRPIYSRELSFVPARRPAFAPHDPQTQALIERYERLQRLPHGERLSPRLEDWRYMDAMKSPEEKQRYIEPIEAVRRDPVAHECELIFLLLVFEPVRRAVSKAFVEARSGLDAPVVDINWSNRAEARMIREIGLQQLYDVTRAGAIEAIFRYPSPPPDRLFPWVRETIAHRTLDHLRGELAEVQTRCPNLGRGRSAAGRAGRLRAASGLSTPKPTDTATWSRLSLTFRGSKRLSSAVRWKPRASSGRSMPGPQRSVRTPGDCRAGGRRGAAQTVLREQTLATALWSKYSSTRGSQAKVYRKRVPLQYGFSFARSDAPWARFSLLGTKATSAIHPIGVIPRTSPR
jgi:hypothetical protein